MAHVEPEALDLEKIRLELAEIARIVGGEESGETSAGINLDDLTMVDLRLVDIIKIVPDAFCKDASFQPGKETCLSVLIPDLFDQLASGKVETTVGRLVADIPEDYLTPFVDEHAEDKVVLPLSMVVSAVQPGELRKRTAAKEKDRGEKMLPNLFSTGSKPVNQVVVEPPTDAVEPVSVAADVPAVEPQPEPVVEPAIAAKPEPEPVAEEPAVEIEIVDPIVTEVAETVASAPAVVEPIVIHEVRAEPVIKTPAAAESSPRVATPMAEPVTTAAIDEDAELAVVDAD